MRLKILTRRIVTNLSCFTYNRTLVGWHVNLMPFAVLNEFPSDWKARAKQKLYGRLMVFVPCVQDLLISKLKRGEPRDKLHAQWANQLL